MQITSVVNQKGGVGKTSLTVGTAAALAEQGKRVLLIDLDPQGHATTELLGLPEVPASEPSLAKALTKTWRGQIEDLVVPHNKSRLGPGGAFDVIPTSPGMFDLIRRLDQFRVPGWQLARVIQFANYDHILIDCPPAQDVLTNNALAASHGILVPVQPDKTSIRALKLLREQVAYVEQTLKREPILYYGLVPGLYRRPISHYAALALKELGSFGIPMLPHLPLGVVMNESAAHGIPVTTFAPETLHADSFRRISQILAAYHANKPVTPIMPGDQDQDFIFEDFISEVAKARNTNDNGARKKLYDFMPKRPQ